MWRATLCGVFVFEVLSVLLVFFLMYFLKKETSVKSDCGERWRRALNSSGVLSGRVTDLRRKTVSSLTDNLNWAETRLWHCFFWWQATWSRNAETELHDVWSSYTTADCLLPSLSCSNVSLCLHSHCLFYLKTKISTVVFFLLAGLVFQPFCYMQLLHYIECGESLGCI